MNDRPATDPPEAGAELDADAELAEPVPGERRRGSAGAVEITPSLFLAGWLGVLSPAIAWGVAAATLRGLPGGIWTPVLALGFLALVPAWPLGCLGAAVARMERDRRAADWPLPLTDAAGGFLAGNLCAAAFLLLIERA